MLADRVKENHHSNGDLRVTNDHLRQHQFLVGCSIHQDGIHNFKTVVVETTREMKLSAIAALLAVGLFMDGALAFQSQSLSTQQRSTSLYGYVPSGFTPEQYKKFKEEEAKKNQKKNLGRMGPKGFQSRSFQSFQEALERGEATHLLPVWNAQARVKSGELKPEDIPYMQRGGECHRSFG